MKITVEFHYDIDDVIDDLEFMNIKVGKREFKNAFKKAFEDFAYSVIDAEYDCRGMRESIVEKLIQENILEEI